MKCERCGKPCQLPLPEGFTLPADTLIPVMCRKCYKEVYYTSHYGLGASDMSDAIKYGTFFHSQLEHYYLGAKALGMDAHITCGQCDTPIKAGSLAAKFGLCSACMTAKYGPPGSAIPGTASFMEFLYKAGMGKLDDLIGKSFSMQIPVKDEGFIPVDWWKEFIPKPQSRMTVPQDSFGERIVTALAAGQSRNEIKVAEYVVDGTHYVDVWTASYYGKAIRTKSSVHLGLGDATRRGVEEMIQAVINMHINPAPSAFIIWSDNEDPTKWASQDDDDNMEWEDD